MSLDPAAYSYERRRSSGVSSSSASTATLRRASVSSLMLSTRLPLAPLGPQVTPAFALADPHESMPAIAQASTSTSPTSGFANFLVAKGGNPSSYYETANTNTTAAPGALSASFSSSSPSLLSQSASDDTVLCDFPATLSLSYNCRSRADAHSPGLHPPRPVAHWMRPMILPLISFTAVLYMLWGNLADFALSIYPVTAFNDLPNVVTVSWVHALATRLTLSKIYTHVSTRPPRGLGIPQSSQQGIPSTSSSSRLINTVLRGSTSSTMQDDYSSRRTSLPALHFAPSSPYPSAASTSASTLTSAAPLHAYPSTTAEDSPGNTGRNANAASSSRRPLPASTIAVQPNNNINKELPSSPSSRRQSATPTHMLFSSSSPLPPLASAPAPAPLPRDSGLFQQLQSYVMTPTGSTSTSSSASGSGSKRNSTDLSRSPPNISPLSRAPTPSMFTNINPFRSKPPPPSESRKGKQPLSVHVEPTLSASTSTASSSTAAAAPMSSSTTAAVSAANPNMNIYESRRPSLPINIPTSATPTSTSFRAAAAAALFHHNTQSHSSSSGGSKKNSRSSSRESSSQKIKKKSSFNKIKGLASSLSSSGRSSPSLLSESDDGGMASTSAAAAGATDVLVPSSDPGPSTTSAFDLEYIFGDLNRERERTITASNDHHNPLGGQGAAEHGVDEARRMSISLDSGSAVHAYHHQHQQHHPASPYSAYANTHNHRLGGRRTSSKATIRAFGIGGFGGGPGHAAPAVVSSPTTGGMGPGGDWEDSFAKFVSQGDDEFARRRAEWSFVRVPDRREPATVDMDASPIRPGQSMSSSPGAGSSSSYAPYPPLPATPSASSSYTGSSISSSPPQPFDFSPSPPIRSPSSYSHSQSPPSRKRSRSNTTNTKASATMAISVPVPTHAEPMGVWECGALGKYWVGAAEDSSAAAAAKSSTRSRSGSHSLGGRLRSGSGSASASLGASTTGEGGGPGAAPAGGEAGEERKISMVVRRFPTDPYVSPPSILSPPPSKTAPTPPVTTAAIRVHIHKHSRAPATSLFLGASNPGAASRSSILLATKKVHLFLSARKADAARERKTRDADGGMRTPISPSFGGFGGVAGDDASINSNGSKSRLAPPVTSSTTHPALISSPVPSFTTSTSTSPAASPMDIAQPAMPSSSAPADSRSTPVATSSSWATISPSNQASTATGTKSKIGDISLPRRAPPPGYIPSFVNRELLDKQTTETLAMLKADATGPGRRAGGRLDGISDTDAVDKDGADVDSDDEAFDSDYDSPAARARARERALDRRSISLSRPTSIHGHEALARDFGTITPEERAILLEQLRLQASAASAPASSAKGMSLGGRLKRLLNPADDSETANPASNPAAHIGTAASAAMLSASDSLNPLARIPSSVTPVPGKYQPPWLLMQPAAVREENERKLRNLKHSFEAASMLPPPKLSTGPNPASSSPPKSKSPSKEKEKEREKEKEKEKAKDQRRRRQRSTRKMQVTTAPARTMEIEQSTDEEFSPTRGGWGSDGDEPKRKSSGVFRRPFGGRSRDEGDSSTAVDPTSSTGSSRSTAVSSSVGKVSEAERVPPASASKSTLISTSTVRPPAPTLTPAAMEVKNHHHTGVRSKSISHPYPLMPTSSHPKRSGYASSGEANGKTKKSSPKSKDVVLPYRNKVLETIAPDTMCMAIPLWDFRGEQERKRTGSRAAAPTPAPPSATSLAQNAFRRASKSMVPSAPSPEHERMWLLVTYVPFKDDVIGGSATSYPAAPFSPPAPPSAPSSTSSITSPIGSRFFQSSKKRAQQQPSPPITSQPAPTTSVASSYEPQSEELSKTSENGGKSVKPLRSFRIVGRIVTSHQLRYSGMRYPGADIHDASASPLPPPPPPSSKSKKRTAAKNAKPEDDEEDPFTAIIAVCHDAHNGHIEYVPEGLDALGFCGNKPQHVRGAVTPFTFEREIGELSEVGREVVEICWAGSLALID
ncbi:hypothetical protein DL93DRAFT_2232339 [Clavulina sp. PMI_390]|nr:hypothetical protein DL93DRAFT_2232339 [Clavulina sp. PMI_390]